MSLAACHRLGLVEAVRYDLSAQAAHGAVSVERRHVLHDARDRGNQLRPVYQLDRGGFRVGFGVARKSARGHIEAAGCVRSDNRLVQSREMVDLRRQRICGGGEGDDVLAAFLVACMSANVAGVSNS
jgi:hypothetical protein